MIYAILACVAVAAVLVGGFLEFRTRVNDRHAREMAVAVAAASHARLVEYQSRTDDLIIQWHNVEKELRAKLAATFQPDTAPDCACGLCGSPKCRSCGRGLLFGHLANTPFCSTECSKSGPKAETWAEFVARTGE